MKRLDSKLLCKCGAVTAIHWFASERSQWIGLEQDLHCYRCHASMDTTQTCKFHVSDVDEMLVIWDEVEVCR